MKGRKNLAWHKFKTDLIVNNEKQEIQLLVREDVNGLHYYDHWLVNKK